MDNLNKKPNKFKNFLKYTGIAYIYLTLFVIFQTFCSFGVLMYKVITDFDFGDRFLELMEPIYYNGNNYWANYDDILMAYYELLSDLIVPILFVSNLCVVIFIGIKIFVTRKKDNIFHKISIDEISLFIFLGIFLNIVISFIIGLLPQNLVDSHSDMTSMVLNGNVFFLVICSGILAPLAEEFIFRYGMMKNLIKINVPFAIIYQAILFGLLHGNLVQGTYAFILGIIFGIIVYKKGNVWYSIILHISINTSSVLVSSMGDNEFFSFMIIFVISIIFALLFNLKNIIKNVRK